MGHWNHRVVKKVYKHEDGIPYEGEDPYYAIAEVHYNDNGEACGCTEAEMAPTGETVEELRICLERMLSALDKPVLDQENHKWARYEDLVKPETINEIITNAEISGATQLCIDDIPFGAYEHLIGYFDTHNIEFIEVKEIEDDDEFSSLYTTLDNLKPWAVAYNEYYQKELENEV